MGMGFVIDMLTQGKNNPEFYDGYERVGSTQVDAPFVYKRAIFISPIMLINN